MEEEAPMEVGIGKKIPVQKVGIIVVVLVLLGAIYFSGAWKALLEVGGGKAELLVIGQLGANLRTVLDSDPSLVKYNVVSVGMLDPNPGQKLEQYKVVLLAQQDGQMPFEHSISRELGEALQNFVRKGGTLIVVLDSGIYSSGPNNTVASDVVGWETNFADVMPVECLPTMPDNKSSCQKPFTVVGRIMRSDASHKIMEGIEMAPADASMAPYSTKALDVRVIGKEIAVIEDSLSGKSFPAIVEKTKLLGKVIYFNYDPGLTPGILQNTLEYVR